MDENRPTSEERDDGMPIIRVTSHDGAARTPSPGKSTHIRSKSQDMLSRGASKVLDKIDNRKTERSSSSMQDRLLNLLLSQVIPADGAVDTEKSNTKRPRTYAEKPNFSVGTMSYNFRRFNARIGPVFVFQNRVFRVLSWRKPSHTLSFLAVYSFVCLDPYLLVVVPLAICLFFIMVPAFLARHPPPPSTLPSELYPLGGPPLAPATRIKPAPDLSKDFFRNMRDLQNSMEDFSRLHDEILKRLLPPTNFSDEAYTSVLFIVMFFAVLLLFVTAHLIPWRFVFLLGGWAVIGSNHPFVQDLLEQKASPETIAQQQSEVQSQLHAFAEADIILDPAPEKREVEIFELQHRNPYDREAEWEPWVFTPHPYDPMSPAMIAGDRPKGTRFFEDVVPPRGWKFADKKWTLDLLSREWVEERCITGVEVEVEGERWVSDLAYEFEDDEDDLDSLAESHKSKKMKNKEIGKEKEKKKAIVTWEEGHGRHKLGEWRRRRWVRLVQRVAIDAGKDDGITVVSNE
ncbi:uncharacterized protein PV09_05315 [Verruconis gallopava]|uniref:TECPR1-like DysF domain-containing protein n=1 Tax=Verruconis gallopava TaxID=253628 RepID=A0A0D2AAG8_9PEZI|nr:uncharacterized protein PV09_05315 [Verruconis gallopava]KIW03555.1 hypothetical protein PV09_05315 [Verruconis gallopava]